MVVVMGHRRLTCHAVTAGAAAMAQWRRATTSPATSSCALHPAACTGTDTCTISRHRHHMCSQLSNQSTLTWPALKSSYAAAMAFTGEPSLMHSSCLDERWNWMGGVAQGESTSPLTEGGGGGGDSALVHCLVQPGCSAVQSRHACGRPPHTWQAGRVRQCVPPKQCKCWLCVHSPRSEVQRELPVCGEPSHSRGTPLLQCPHLVVGSQKFTQAVHEP